MKVCLFFWLDGVEVKAGAKTAHFNVEASYAHEESHTEAQGSSDSVQVTVPPCIKELQGCQVILGR